MTRARPKARTYQGSPCKRGHAGVRRVDNGDCVECAALRFLRFKSTKPERVAAHGRKYYEANTAAVKTRATTWKETNADKVSQADARWRKKNPDLNRAKAQGHRARRRNAEGVFSRADINALIISQDGMCAAHCGAFLCDGYSIDHVVALACGGSNWPDNIQLLCSPCNSAKSALPMDIFLKKRGGDHRRI